jgi:hypothetical protein
MTEFAVSSPAVSSSRIRAHSNEPDEPGKSDDTDKPQIPSQPERHPEGLPDLPNPTEVGEDG